jgi:hypothetical protein
MTTQNTNQSIPPIEVPTAKLSPAEIEQVARIMQGHKPVVTEIKTENPQLPANVSAQALTKEQYAELMARPPISAEEMMDKVPRLKEEMARQAAYNRAEKEPLPDLIEMAFDRNTLEVKLSKETVVLRKLVAFDWMIFKKTKCPLYEALMGNIPEQEALLQLSMPDEKQFELIYQFIRPAQETYKLVVGDVTRFTESAVEEIGCKYSLDDAELLIGSILRHIGITLESKSSVAENTSVADADKKKQA